MDRHNHAMTQERQEKSDDRPNLRYIGILALAAGLILLVGSLLRPADQPVEQQPVSQTELTRLRRAAARTSLQDMSEYFSEFSAELSRHVVRLEEFDGSGVLWDDGGTIVAAVRGGFVPETVRWITDNDTPSIAQIDAASPLLPVALLRAPPIVTTPPPVMRSTRDLKLGDWLLAISRQSSGEYVFSPGWFAGPSIATCQGRQLRVVLTSHPLGLEMLGAGLFDIQGALVAIVIQCEAEAVAMAAAEVDAVLLLANSNTSRLLWRFGIRMDMLDEDEIAYFNSREGFLIREVWKGSHAERLGLAPGDLILSLGDRPVIQISELQPLFGSAPPAPEDEPLELEILRSGSRVRIPVGPPTQPETEFGQLAPGAGLILTGPAPGYRIESVVPGSPAAEAGLHAGDRVLRIGDTVVRGPAQVLSLLDSPERRPAFVVVDRGSKHIGLLIP